MAKFDVYNMDGQVIDSIELSSAVFGIEPNQDVLHRVVLNQLANRRQGTHKVKTRSEVRGGGKRPYRQKGTGRARHGSVRSAQHVGGGIIFGPSPRNYRYKLPKKMRRLAMKSALSLATKKMTVIDKIEFAEIKTKQMLSLLENLKLDSTVLVVSLDRDSKLDLSARNIVGVKTEVYNTINVFDLLKFDKVLFTKEALTKIEEVYA